jgi:hypothetical protein
MADTQNPIDGAMAFYSALLRSLCNEQLPFLVGGSFAFSRFTGIQRPTKDLDLFIRRTDWHRLVRAATGAGWRTQLTYPHWLGKIRHEEHFVDAIFSSGNGLSPVDDDWFRHAVATPLLGQRVYMVPAEESLWTKAFIMERERFDGADVAHLLLACAPALNWQRLLQRFGTRWRVLLAHLVLFGFIYPSEQSRIPRWVMNELMTRLQREVQHGVSAGRWCAGTLLSREQYLSDLRQQGYWDARLLPDNGMSADDIAAWTAAIGAGAT